MLAFTLYQDLSVLNDYWKIFIIEVFIFCYKQIILIIISLLASTFSILSTTDITELILTSTCHMITSLKV